MTTWQSELEAGAARLANLEPAFEPLVAKGLPKFKRHDNHFRELVVAILSQQISTKAAKTMFERFETLYGGFPDPLTVANTPIEDLRGIGISGIKSGYILDLAARAADGRLAFKSFTNMTNQDIIAELTAVKGIGIWTAQVFLIFCMGRLDVMASTDLGIQMGVKKLCDLDKKPTPLEVERISEEHGWKPYESIACWYLWRLLDDNLLLYEER